MAEKDLLDKNLDYLPVCNCSNCDFSKFFYLVFRKQELLNIASHDDSHLTLILIDKKLR